MICYGKLNIFNLSLEKRVKPFGPCSICSTARHLRVKLSTSLSHTYELIDSTDTPTDFATFEKTYFIIG